MNNIAHFYLQFCTNEIMHQSVDFFVGDEAVSILIDRFKESLSIITIPQICMICCAFRVEPALMAVNLIINPVLELL